MTTFHTTSIEELTARGRIRDAAPDLYRALSALMPADFDQHPEDFAPEWHAARAALAKARAQSRPTDAVPARADGGASHG